MAEITVYGASDDLIEVEGDIREEFNPIDEDDGDLLAFSDGTILRIRYSQTGVWRLSLVCGGEASMSIDPAPEDDDDCYSDRVTLTSPTPFKWVVHGKAWAHG